MRKIIAIGVIGLTLSACAVQKTWVPTGGSRGDGTVTLSYEYGLFETPQVDQAQGIQAAKERCAAWGYKDADPFGGTTSQCNQTSGTGSCNRWLVSAVYQCIGRDDGL